MPDPIVSIRSLSHRYGDRPALDAISLDIAEAEIFSLLGPNGSGKTTLFRILCTLLPVQSGSVSIAGVNLAADPMAVRKLIGVVFQSPSLDKHLTAEENLRHHGHLHGLSGQTLSSRIDAMLERFDLADRRRDLVNTLSGGLRRRVELAKGLLTRPRILLMDEPSTGLDPAARIEMWQALQAARDADRVTILLATHLMDEADKSDRLAILDRGKIAAIGAPAELKNSLGGDVITLASANPSALSAALKEKLSIVASPVQGLVRFERESAHQFIPILVESLPGLIDSVSVGKPTLEDVFIRVTGRGFIAAEAE